MDSQIGYYSYPQDIGSLRYAKSYITFTILRTEISDLSGGEDVSPPPTAMIDSVIRLNIPNSLNSGYRTHWGATDMDIARMGVGAADKFVQLMDEQRMPVAEDFEGAAGPILSFILKGVPQLGVYHSIAPNPKQEQQFINVDFRTFEFDFVFAPRNQGEAESVVKIISLFKEYMHPTFIDDGKFVYGYPSTFDIKLMFNGVENDYLSKIQTSHLVNMDVDYTPNSAYTVFDNGMPTQIKLKLMFRETRQLTGELIREYNF